LCLAMRRSTGNKKRLAGHAAPRHEHAVSRRPAARVLRPNSMAKSGSEKPVVCGPLPPSSRLKVSRGGRAHHSVPWAVPSQDKSCTDWQAWQTRGHAPKSAARLAEKKGKLRGIAKPLPCTPVGARYDLGGAAHGAERWARPPLRRRSCLTLRTKSVENRSSG
jgi:hypothetical protein